MTALRYVDAAPVEAPADEDDRGDVFERAEHERWMADVEAATDARTAKLRGLLRELVDALAADPWRRDPRVDRAVAAAREALPERDESLDVMFAGKVR